jgi:transcriptional antiterminator NusG
MIYIIRTTTGREDIVVDMLASKIRAQNLDIQSVFHPTEIKGYIFAEGSLGNVQKLVQGVMHIKGIIEQPPKLDEIRHFLEHKKEALMLDAGDIVEIIGGPFKGEKGKIMRLSKGKEEITVELLEASTPIPVTIATEFVKIIKRQKKKEEW